MTHTMLWSFVCLGKNCKACFLSCQAHHQFFQSQLSIEPSTSSSGGYSHTNTEFLCSSSSILKNKFKIGSSTISRKPRRPQRYGSRSRPSKKYSQCSSSVSLKADGIRALIHVPNSICLLLAD